MRLETITGVLMRLFFIISMAMVVFEVLSVMSGSNLIILYTGGILNGIVSILFMQKHIKSSIKKDSTLSF